MSEQMIGSSYDTDNETEYALTCNIIRDFCKDAISSGRLPSDREIHYLVSHCAIIHDDGEERPMMVKPSEAARLAGVSTRTITRMCDEGQLPAVKLRGTWRINRESLLDLLNGGA